jgi:hypothetical protein
MLKVDIAHPWIVEDLLDGVVAVLHIFLQQAVQEVFKLG